MEHLGISSQDVYVDFDLNLTFEFVEAHKHTRLWDGTETLHLFNRLATSPKPNRPRDSVSVPRMFRPMQSDSNCSEEEQTTTKTLQMIQKGIYLLFL